MKLRGAPGYPERRQRMKPRTANTTMTMMMIQSQVGT
jgi:hypothetical protein